jgi:hypothetical protein
MTAKRYRLPDVLGGGEFGGSVVGIGAHGPLVQLEIPGAGILQLFEDVLTEVRPEIPEPPVGSVVLVKWPESVATSIYGRGVIDGRDAWRLGGVGGPASRWASLSEGSTITLMTPQLAPVPLPWRSEFLSNAARCLMQVDPPDGDGEIPVSLNGTVFLDPTTARAFGQALICAADLAGDSETSR